MSICGACTARGFCEQSNSLLQKFFHKFLLKYFRLPASISSSSLTTSAASTCLRNKINKKILHSYRTHVRLQFHHNKLDKKPKTKPAPFANISVILCTIHTPSKIAPLSLSKTQVPLAQCGRCGRRRIFQLLPLTRSAT